MGNEEKLQVVPIPFASHERVWPYMLHSKYRVQIGISDHPGQSYIMTEFLNSKSQNLIHFFINEPSTSNRIKISIFMHMYTPSTPT